MIAWLRRLTGNTATPPPNTTAPGNQPATTLLDDVTAILRQTAPPTITQDAVRRPMPHAYAADRRPWAADTTLLTQQAAVVLRPASTAPHSAADPAPPAGEHDPTPWPPADHLHPYPPGTSTGPRFAVYPRGGAR